ncbi:glycoside hydrolase [Desulfitobacterium metallireducens DSM 15288]|uniref:Glycoside hydrolase n=1 Tax=Desulfitobacterium metallireducens DSM 15288 TaxID=871968 RepID=W0EF03_9FIRM|nr:glycoside hydrolase [Desulfitobacterium metallireducens DSM 15288]
MKVLILAGWYPNHSNPMKGTFIREQALALHKAGLPVAVFYPFDEELKSGEMKEAREEGLQVYRANTVGEGNRFVGRFASYFRSIRMLERITNDVQPDLLHVHVGYPAGIIAYLFTRNHSIPYLITEHMSYLQDYVAKWQHRILLKRTFEHAQRVLPVSTALQKQFTSWGWNVKTKVVPNVVDTERFQLDRNASKEGVHLLFAGNMEATEVKGLQYLLPAFAQVLRNQRKDQPLHLDLVGDGAKRKDYEALAQKLGITDSVTFHGRVNPGEMPGFYQKADLLVLSSVKETFGCVLIEAMASGKPVLATACGGPQDIIKEKTGLLVPPESTEALAKGMQDMLASLQDFDEVKIRNYALNHYSPEAVARMLIEIYEEIR